jgi:DNA helicase-2/ATP-dependent DNA helicase PcrA
MATEVARDFANTRNGLAVAPAGCGKTHLIADAVSECQGRQLVLTHTHAGVRALLDHMKRRGLSKEQFRVATIDGFALRYAGAFPAISGWTEQHPHQDDSWKQLRAAAVRPLQRSSVRQVVRCSYSGVFVDEYQDCTAGQHQLITAIAEILPCRVLGDPLQSIFWRINEGDHVAWSDVEDHFVKSCEVSTPHRWKGRNHELGEWLLDVRKRLIAGEPIDLQNAPLTRQAMIDQKSQLQACFSTGREHGHSTVALRKWPAQCHRLVRFLKGSYETMESVECEDLQTWAQRIESSQGAERACHIAKCAKVCLARLPTAVSDWIKAFDSGRFPNPQRHDYKIVVNALKQAAGSEELSLVDSAMDAFERLDGSLVYVRRELWRELRRALNEFGRIEGRTLTETAWTVRNRVRHIGRRVDRRCVSTTLLVKGLQFDHAIILDANDLEDAENLYVALSRASRSLTVFSGTPTIQRDPPAFVTS